MILRQIIFLILILCYGTAHSQLSQTWLRTHNGSANGTDEALFHTTDSAGNVYAAGKIFSTGSGFDIFVSKYDANGSTIWERTFDGTGNAKDIAYAVKVDNSGNVFLAGESTGDSTGADFITIKYSSDGSEQWINRYDGNSNSMDFIEKLLIDDLGNVIVLGTSYEIGNLFDLVLIKYSNAGIMQWTKTYNGQASGNDIADDLALDAAGNIFVAANSFGSGTLSDFLILKYNSNGDTLWSRKYNGPVNGHDNFTSMTIDNNGDIAIAGSSVGSGTSLDFAVLKYSSMGELLWLRRYTGPATSSPDEPKAIAHDSAGNIYVTGTSVGQSTSYDYLTVKYSPSGDMIWDRRYTGQFNNSFDEPTGVCTDASGNVFVAGMSDGAGALSDMVILKYDSVGSLIWNTRYNSASNGFDKPNKISIDNYESVLISGSVTGVGTGMDFAVLKYSQLTAVGSTTELSPSGFSLSQNYPNPFNPSTTIGFTLPFDGSVSLNIFDVEGKKVAQLINKIMPAGSHSLAFNVSESKPQLPTGTYFYRLNYVALNSGMQFSNVKKMLLIR